jgi:hypothetical protein
VSYATIVSGTAAEVHAQAMQESTSMLYGRPQCQIIGGAAVRAAGVFDMEKRT